MPNKNTGPTALIVHLPDTPPEYVLSLRRLDDHPSLAGVVAAKEKLSDALDMCEKRLPVALEKLALRQV